MFQFLKSVYKMMWPPTKPHQSIKHHASAHNAIPSAKMLTIPPTLPELAEILDLKWQTGPIEVTRKAPIVFTLGQETADELKTCDSPGQKQLGIILECIMWNLESMPDPFPPPSFGTFSVAQEHDMASMVRHRGRPRVIYASSDLVMEYVSESGEVSAGFVFTRLDDEDDEEYQRGKDTRVDCVLGMVNMMKRKNSPNAVVHGAALLRDDSMSLFRLEHSPGVSTPSLTLTESHTGPGKAEVWGTDDELAECCAFGHDFAHHALWGGDCQFNVMGEPEKEEKDEDLDSECVLVAEKAQLGINSGSR